MNEPERKQRNAEAQAQQRAEVGEPPAIQRIKARCGVHREALPREEAGSEQG